MISNFLFHRVSPERDRLWDPMDVALFDRCVAYINRNYKVRLLEDLVLSTDLHRNEKFATIQFDDGYKDNIDYAAPILARYGCKASFYVVTDSIDQNLPTWTHILEYQFQHTKVIAIDLRFDFLPADLHTTGLPTAEARIAYVRRLKPQLKHLSHEDRQRVMDRIAQTYTDVEIPRIMMDWDDLRKLKAAGHYISSHTVTHCMLGTMTDENQIRSELATSARKIEAQLGHRPLTISYPIGSYNDTTIRLSREAGYEIGLAVKQRQYNPATDTIFEIPRIELYNESWWKTKMRITNILERIKTTIGYK